MARAERMPKSCRYTGGCAVGLISNEASSSTSRPMFSSTAARRRAPARPGGDAQAQGVLVALHRTVQAHDEGGVGPGFWTAATSRTAERGETWSRCPPGRRSRRRAQRPRAFLADALHEGVLELVFPAPARLRDVVLDRADVEAHALLGRAAHRCEAARAWPRTGAPLTPRSSRGGARSTSGSSRARRY